MKNLLIILVVAFFATAEEYSVDSFQWMYYNDMWDMSTPESGDIAYDDVKKNFMINFSGGVPELALEVVDFNDLRVAYDKFLEWDRIAQQNGVRDTKKIISYITANVWWEPTFTNDWYTDRNIKLTAKFTVIDGNSYITIYGPAESGIYSVDVFIYMTVPQAKVFMNEVARGKESKYKSIVNSRKKTEGLFN